MKSKVVHGEKYSYERTKYTYSKVKVEITCFKHGVFNQAPNVHLKGIGCPHCGSERTSESKKLSQEDIINRAIKAHGDKYDYSDSLYIGINKKMKIKCVKHGIFEQTPHNHITHLTNCPKCYFKVSKQELEIQDFIKSLSLKVESNRRDIIKPYELDIYIPDLQKAIEYNGMRWHYRKETCKKEKGYHAMKSNLCREKGIKLLHVREDLWIRDKEKMKNIIKNFIYGK